MLNLTPHSIHIYDAKSDKTLVIPPSGVVARVIMEEYESGTLAVEGLPVPLIRREETRVEGLTEDGSSCLVSSMVLNTRAAFEHGNCYAPDTGPTAIRNDEGQIVAVTRLAHN